MVASGESQSELRILMPAQSAVHRHQTIPDPMVTANARRKGEASHPFRQRHRLPTVWRVPETVAPSPIVVHQATIPQIGDPGTADTRDTCQRSAIAAQSESDIYQVPDTFQRRAMVRRAQKDKISDAVRPAVAGRRAVSVRAAGYKTAATMANNGYVPHRHGPLSEESFGQLGESATVREDVQATVIVQMHRRPPEVFGERRCLIAAAPRPLQVIRAEAMHQDKNLSARLRDAGPEVAAFNETG